MGGVQVYVYWPGGVCVCGGGGGGGQVYVHQRQTIFWLMAPVEGQLCQQQKEDRLVTLTDWDVGSFIYFEIADTFQFSSQVRSD